MKTVVSPDMVAHLWANKSQSSARNSNRSFYFEDDTIYSYGRHFPIARHATHKGEPCILFTVRDYSPTTSNHKSMVRRAIQDGTKIFFVREPETHGNFQKMEDDATKWLAEQAEQKKTDKRENAKRNRANKKAQQKAIDDYFPVTLPAWRNNEINRMPTLTRSFPIALRLTPDKKRIQTTQGAETLTTFARHAYTILALRVASNGEPLISKEFTWGNFTGFELYKLTPESWYLKVGCHNIPFSEVELIAKQLGLTEAVGA